METVEELTRAAYFRLFAADQVLSRVVRPGETVADVGCSDGRGSEVLGSVDSTGFDIYEPALRAAVTRGRRRRVVLADVRRLPVRDGAFDVVVSLDVVEHFFKPDALALITELERAARRLVVLLTPNGLVPQPPGEDEPWQEHRCGFDAAELEALGYSVTGRGGPAGWRGPYGSFRGGPLGKLAAVVAAPLVNRRPTASFHLLGVKQLSRHGD